MIIKELPTEFEQGIPLIEAIEAAGFEAYFVGGSVRDVILDKQIHDVDIATSAFPEEVKQIFPKTIDVGIEHGTVLVLFGEEQYEITTFRTESTYQDYRRPDKVTFVRSLEEDLKRRDFTMNALAMNKSGEVIDLFKGIEAIHNRQIVAVGDPSERFNEDALRMLRGLRFSSQLDFNIEIKTLKAIEEHHQLLEKISVERICVEWVKLLLGRSRNKGLENFIRTRCFEYCPGLKKQEIGLSIFLELDEDYVFPNEAVAWLTLCYVLDIKSPTDFLKKWKCSNKLMHEVEKSLIQLRMRDFFEWTPLTLYESGLDTIYHVEEARTALGKDSVYQEAIKEYEVLPIKSMRDLTVTGKEILTELDVSPGPWLGELLSKLEKSVILTECRNEPNQLLEASRIWSRANLKK